MKDKLPPDRRRCSHCTRVKPIAEFYFLPSRGWHHSWCRTCVRIDAAERYADPEVKARRLAYRRRPEVLARQRAADALRNRTSRKKAQQQASRRTALGKLKHAQATDRNRLGRIEAGARGLGKLETTRRRLAARAAEIARIEQAMDGDRKGPGRRAAS